MSALSREELGRYQRHLTLSEVGLAGQEKLKAARILVVGAGGLGSPALLYLAASGVGTLGVVDCDKVELSNLQRQILFTTADIGKAKALVACERLLALNPAITVNAHAVELRADNAAKILKAYDVVLDGTDRLSTRYLVNDACVLFDKPLVTAAIHRFEGQAMTYVPGQGPCYRCLFSEADDSVIPNCAQAGVLGVLPGVLGAIQATEAIKLVLGAGSALGGRLLTYDALDMHFQEFHFERRDDCPVCGDRPAITALEDSSMPTFNDSPALRRMNVVELNELLQRGGADESVALVDVREPYEFDSGHLPNAVNIPLGELPSRIHEIAAAAEPIFICMGGSRSLAACNFALQAGFASASNVEGGMRAWEQQFGESSML